jgi:FKBP-type peptidyl-prolyl cis-trans isomerase 2/SAM-dependent methyltransferase
MDKITPDSLANISFELIWQKNNITHTEHFYGRRINFWRDCFPTELYEKLLNKAVGEKVTFYLQPNEAIGNYDYNKVRNLKPYQFNRHFMPDTIIKPQKGRFYPKGILKDMTGVFKANIEPFRYLGSEEDKLIIDLNHPLAGINLTLKAQVDKVIEKIDERGGSCTDWFETITDGPGMQARINGEATDFFSDNPFERINKEPDNNFYLEPRFVNHIDDTALENITRLYEKILTTDMSILDLMSSWTSHLPKHIKFAGINGLGLNEKELQANKKLTDYILHDLNENPKLPFDNETFNAVVCTVSIEYLIHPFMVFREIARVLKPNGYFIVTFSNRWFPPKVISIWQEILEFERVGLVIEYFLESNLFKNISTYSIRGLPRPEGDKYYPEKHLSDPVFAVWGQKA